MAVIDDTRRWLKDQFVTDEHITMTPKKAIRQLETALPDLSPSERARNIDHLRNYADSYYLGRHREAVPREVTATFAQLSKEAARLDIVDRAREVVASYGGPPTRQTIADSLERSAQERAIRLQNAVGSSVAPQSERVSGTERSAAGPSQVAAVQQPSRTRSREVGRPAERVPNGPGETVSRGGPEPSSEQTVSVQKQRGNKREVSQEQGLGMGV
jgi:hypothetical protein